MNGFKKRITCVLCAVVISTTALLSCPLRVQATAVPAPVSSEATLEALMLLWNLLVNGMIAGGASEAIADYDSEKALFDAFLDFANDALGIPTYEDFYAYTPDGQIITMDDLVAAYDKGTVTMPDWWVDEWDVDEETGEDVIQLPNEQVWGKYRVGFGDDFASILESWEERGGGTGDSGEPEEPKEPEFKKIDAFAIGAGFLKLMSDFFTSVFKGEVEEIDPSQYYQYTWSGYEMNEAGEYVIRGNLIYPDRVVQIYDTLTKPVVMQIEESSNLLKALNLYNNSMVQICNLDYTRTDVSGGVATGKSSLYSLSDCLYSFNIPVFSNETDAKIFLLTSDNSDVLNLKKFEHSALIKSIPSTLAPLTGLKLSPSTLQQTYAGMKTAYETEVKPNISTDTKTNTETYTETMQETVTETVTQVSPAPTPTPTPTPDTPETDTETETETTGMEIDDYKRDLRMVFPFCLPFDFIALLQALDAEPQTPRFEIPFVVPALNLEMTVDFNLSFLDDVMEGLRTIELVGFIVFLIFATGKLIKW